MIKKLLFISALALSIHTFAQTTAIPDVNFEQALIDLGWDSDETVNGEVLTSDINSKTSLNVASLNISDLTGIEDFVGLNFLYCHANNLTSLDVSNLTALTFLSCRVNQITSLDLTNNSALTDVIIQENLITGEIDLSAATGLIKFTAYNNNILRVNVKNGNNTNFVADASFNVNNNPNLDCIEVDDVAYSTANWTKKAASVPYSIDCDATASISSTESINVQLGQNPVNETLRISLDSNAKLSIISINGQTINTANLAIGNNEINVSNLKPGVYLLKIQTESGTVTKKIIKA